MPLSSGRWHLPRSLPRLLAVAVSACAFLLSASPVWAQIGRLTLYVFNEGTPVRNIEVLVDDHLVAWTGDNGVAMLSLDAGIHELELRVEDHVVLEQQIIVTQDEVAQWIVDISGGGSALYDVESSHLEEIADQAVLGDEPAAAGNPGTISGILTSAEDGSPIEGARIFISGISGDIRSGSDGRFEAEVPAGSRSVSILHSGFNALTRDNIEIPENGTTTLELELTLAGSELPEFIVVAPYIAGSLASVMEERQEADTISDILSAEQIARSGDSDAAGALKRVAGLTLVGDGFIYVRGLGERYSSTVLNGSAVPSPDPTRRVVPLDLFPADILQSVLVQKTFSPWVPGDFGGGTVELRTVGIPEGPFFNAGGSLEYLDGTTFSDGWRYDGGSRDWFGYDDGTRDLPASMCGALCDGTQLQPASPVLGGGFSPEEIERFGEDLSGVWDISPEDIDPNGDASLSLGNRWNNDQWSLGYTASGLWSQDWQTRSEIRRVFTATNQGLAPVEDLVRDVTFRDMSTSWFGSAGVAWNDQHAISLTYMLLRKSRDRAQIETGISESPDEEQLRRRLQWQENELWTAQLAGQHVFAALGEMELDWMLATAEATREEPKTRTYLYESDNTGQLALTTSAESNSVNYSLLEDTTDNWDVNLGKRFDFGSRSSVKLQFGLGGISRDRNSTLRRFSFKDIGPLSRDRELRRMLSLEDVLTDETIGQNGFQLRETTQATDNYTATQDQTLSFANVEYFFGERFRVGVGMRQEDNQQRVETFPLFQPDAPPVVGELDEKDRLPAFGLTWGFSADMQLRLAYSETLNRPDFRELAAAPYEDPLLDETIIGNPGLEQASIKNYDLRWEWYLTAFESLSLAAFYKEFTDPIEKIIQPGAFNVTTLTNAMGAENSGVEFDFRLDLGRLSSASKSVPVLRHVPFDDFYIAGNLAWIESEIRLDPEEVLTNTNDTRPLEGQSPHVINLQLGYDSPDERWSATLLYNTFGERIVKVGLLGAPDIYEQPVHALDFTSTFRFNSTWSFGLKLKNILDDTFQFTQGDEVTRQYQKGRAVSISFTYTN